MIHRYIHLHDLGMQLEQIELRGGVRVTCVPDLGPVQWPREHLLRYSMDEGLRSAINSAPIGAVAPDDTTIEISFNIYLIQTSIKTILIDAGVGNNKNRPDRPAWHYRQGSFLDVLAALDVRTENVDVVVNTHLHADHVGWNTVATIEGSWTPTFPKAVYVAPKEELDTLTRRSEQAETPEALLHGAWVDSILPIIRGPGFRTVEAGDRIDGLEFIALPGHTPGMLGLLLSSEDESIMFSADAIHHPLQLRHGTGASNFCADPERSIATRMTLLERCRTENLLLAPYHFPVPTFGFVEETEGGFRMRSPGSSS
jgi:glyoxylase-like metal-dependent hydrolase (beta-lactamase superfamily II)